VSETWGGEDELWGWDAVPSYRGCPMYDEYGACHCSTGVVGTCVYPTEPAVGGEDDR